MNINPLVIAIAIAAPCAQAQEIDHSKMHHAAAAPATEPATMEMAPTPMTGMYGPYPMTREASGTSWQPDSAPMEGIHTMNGPWMTMLHGYVDAVYDRQGGPRGARKGFAESMLMAMAQRSLGGGTLGLRAARRVPCSHASNGWRTMNCSWKASRCTATSSTCAS